MDITISGRHVDITEAMRTHAREKVSKLGKYSTHLMRAKVTLVIHGDRHTAEIVATVRGHSELVAKCETHDMYVAIDRATNKIEKQLHRLEERFRSRRQRRPEEETPRTPEAGSP